MDVHATRRPALGQARKYRLHIEKPSKQEYDAPAGCLIHLFWMIVGNAMLVFCVMAIAQGNTDLFAPIDALFWILVGTLLLTRYVDIWYFKGKTADGDAATIVDFKRYAVLLGFIAIVLWIGAHVYSAVSSDAPSSNSERIIQRVVDIV